MKSFYRNGLFVVFLLCFALSRGQENTNKKRQIKDIEELRKEIFKSRQNALGDVREKSTEQLAEINTLKDNILNSSIPFVMSTNLTNWLKENTSPLSSSLKSPKLGMMVEEAISDPNINIIDEHVKEIVNPNVLNSFQPDVEEIRLVAKMKHSESSTNNLYRETLKLKSIKEETEYNIGYDVELWKTLSLEKSVALIGKSNNSLILVVGSNNAYNIVKEFKIEEAKTNNMCIETFNIWDSTQARVRNIILIGVDGELIWHEIVDEKDVKEIHRWRIIKSIEKLTYIQHDGSDLLMIAVLDEAQRPEMKFIEFDLQNEEFWMIQAFKLPKPPKSIAFIEAGRDLIVAYTQENLVSIYRRTNTKYERAKFSFLKNIDAANVTTLSGFRIGGHSYLAIGGDHPQILRYFNNDFHPQTILSQTFGHVTEFLPIPIRVYRDDLILLVQHTITFRTHSLVVVDALIWNGIAFENSPSVSCKIAADPSANGFTCILDNEREEGLLGASFIVTEKNNSIHIIIPRNEAHSGLFKVDYEIIEAEDPLMKEIENVKRAIELINGMLDLEESVKEQVEEALKTTHNLDEDFTFSEISLDEIDADIIHFDGNVTLNSDKIEFLDIAYSRDDFMVDLEEIEKTLEEDEEKVREIDALLNKLIRKNRQTQTSQADESPVYYIGPYHANGRFDAKTIRVLPQDRATNRQKRQVDPIQESRISELRVDAITVKNINGIPIEDFVFHDDEGILDVSNTNIVFHDSIQVDNVFLENDGKVNGIDFNREVLAVDSEHFPKFLSFDKVVADDVFINKLNDVPVDLKSLHNISTNFDAESKLLYTKEAFMRQRLKVKTVNGIDWDDLMSQIVLINNPSSIQNLTVNGNVIFVDYLSALNTQTLNGLSFPSDYVLKTGPTETLISGSKTFTKKLYTNAIDTDGTINGIEPHTLITLDQQQEIPGETTFSSVEVSGQLEVHGTVSGKKLDDFLPNPSLEHSKEILADCTFKELIVEGNVKVENSLHGQDIRAALDDVVYESNDKVLITGSKTFKNLKSEKDVEISSGYIKDVPISNIMTTVGDQHVKINRFAGDIYFTNLKLIGLFDGINATDLEMNSIRTFGDQFIQTPLNIANHLSAKAIDIKTSLNEVNANEFYFIDEPITFPSQTKVGFHNLNVVNLKVNDDIKGNGKVANLNLRDVEQNYMSKSIEQNIVYPVKVDKLTVSEMFNGNLINEMDFEAFKAYLMDLKNFKANLLSGKHKLNSLIIDGDVKLKYINDKDFEFIMNHAIWLNRPNVISASLKFLDEIEIHDKLILEKALNGKDFTSFLENWISKKEDPIIINSNKVIQKSVMVEENLEVAEINNIPFENILRNEDVLESHNLKIIGTVDVNKLYVKKEFNHENANTLQNLYIYDNNSNTHTVNGNVKIPSNSQIRHLNSQHLNKLDVKQWLSDLIRVTDQEIHSKAKIFRSAVMAEEGAYIDLFNDLNLKELIENIVVIKENQIVNVRANVHFLDDFYAELVGLKGNLTTDFINGLSLFDWVEDSFPIHTDYYIDTLYADSRFIKAANIQVGSINKIPFDSFFTLHTNQTIDHIVEIGTADVKKPLIVNGLVSNMDIKSERENTVMAYDTDPIIDTKIIISDALVLNDVTTRGLVNSKQIEDIVLLNSSPDFYSSLTFNNLEVSSVHSNDRISSINFTKWFENTVWKSGKDTQYISGNWKLKTAYLQDNVSGNGLINGQPVNEIEKNLNKNVNEIEMALSNYTVEYRSMCEKLQYRADNYAKGSIYVLKYFEEAFKITENDIFSYYLFETHSKKQYLFINTNCTTSIYKWQRHEENFKKLSTVETGVVYTWHKLEPEANQVYIITNSKMVANAPCTYGGTISWKFINDNLIHFAPISYEADINEIIVYPSNPKSFYAIYNTDVVVNFDVSGKRLETWSLPFENYTYSFVPSDILSGLNINNGRRIFTLESQFLKRGRRQRSVDQDKLKVSRAKAHPDDSPTFTIKRPEIPNYSIPTIPSKQVKTTKKVNFLSKIQDAGEVIRRSFNLHTDYLTSNSTKLSRFNDTDGNKLLFVMRPPNIVDLRDKLVKKDFGQASTKEDKLDKGLETDLKEIQEVLEKSVNASVAGTVEATTEADTNVEQPFTPRVIMPEDDSSEKETEENNVGDINENTDKWDENVAHENSLLKSEPVVHSVTVFNGNGVSGTENFIIPEHGQGEVITVNVGTEKSKKSLYAITRKRNSVIHGSNMIEIYSDIITGKVFQYIVSTDPSNILSMHFRDETLLAFLESRREVKVYIYRGIQGFTLFKSISLPDYAYQMSSVTLQSSLQYKCDHRYLVFQFEKELVFMNIVVDGNCGLSHIECDGE